MNIPKTATPELEPVAWRWKVSPLQLNWQYSDAPPAKFPVYNLELLYPAAPAQCDAVTDEMVAEACDVYLSVYVDDDKDMGDAMRAALRTAISKPAPRCDVQTARAPICCYCDAPLSCAACGREQPDDSELPSSTVQSCDGKASLRLLADLFSESVHETWSKDEIVNIIEDAIRLGSPAPSADRAFVCPRCGTRGTTDGHASTVTSTHQGSK